MVDAQEVLAQRDLKYPSYNRINQFHAFLLFLQESISDTSFKQANKTLKKTTGDLVEVMQIKFSRLNNTCDNGVLITMFLF